MIFFNQSVYYIIIFKKEFPVYLEYHFLEVKSLTQKQYSIFYKYKTNNLYFVFKKKKNTFSLLNYRQPSYVSNKIIGLIVHSIRKGYTLVEFWNSKVSFNSWLSSYSRVCSFVYNGLSNKSSKVNHQEKPRCLNR